MQHARCPVAARALTFSLYTRYPHAGERTEADVNFYQQVWFHRLGTPISEDRYEIGKDFPRIAEIELDSSEDGQWFVAKVANGDGGVPLNIVRKKGTALNGQNPTILYGYGGYGVSETPHFDATLKPWLDRGGVYVVANLRGGGEYGEVWHKQGNLLKKQNVFDDFVAAAKHLIQRKYTSSAKLAVEGGSNGGLLMGAFLTQQPELARAVVAYVGIYDMLRVELDPNGQFNVTEFGTVKDPDQFKALFAYSPLHRVKDGVKYPAVLLTTGENDGRVNPAQSRKMAARLQVATGSGYPILFMSNSSGHGIVTALNERIAQQADVYSFLLKELGVDMTPP